MKHLTALIVGSLTPSTLAYVPSAPIQWMNRVVMLEGPVGPYRSSTAPQQLLVNVPPNKVSRDTVPYFTFNSDNTISLEGTESCIEAANVKSGTGVRLSRCTAEPTQTWNWIPDRHGGNRIQLKDTDKCLYARVEGDFRGAPIVLRECQGNGVEAWKFEETVPPNRGGRYMLINLATLAGVAALSLGAFLRQFTRPPILIPIPAGATSSADEGGVSLGVPVPMQLTPCPSNASQRRGNVPERAKIYMSDGVDRLESASGLTVGEDSAAFAFSDQSLKSWAIFAAAVSAVLSALYILWVRPDTGYSDDFVRALEELCNNNSSLVTVAMGAIFAVVHSGLAAARPLMEDIVGPRIWRVVFACSSLPLAYSWIFYFIDHRYDGLLLWDLHGIPGLSVFLGCINFVSFLFLYPSTFNLLEVAAVDKPVLHLWETGVIRISRHPQLVGQFLWSAAHLAWIGSSFTCLTMAMLVGHHIFGAWSGDRRLRDRHGADFEMLKERTSIMPFAAILDGRQQLPPDYWKEWARFPYFVISIGTMGAYFLHPYMQAWAAVVSHAPFLEGGLF